MRVQQLCTSTADYCASTSRTVEYWLLNRSKYHVANVYFIFFSLQTFRAVWHFGVGGRVRARARSLADNRHFFDRDKWSNPRNPWRVVPSTLGAQSIPDGRFYSSFVVSINYWRTYLLFSMFATDVRDNDVADSRSVCRRAMRVSFFHVWNLFLYVAFVCLVFSFVDNGQNDNNH